MGSFQAQIGWIRQIKRENKNCRAVPFLYDAKQKIPKKLKKYNYGFISSLNRLEKAEKERK